MRLNLDKCVTLHCYRSFNPHLTNYFVENYTLENVNQHPYFGVILNKTMSFTAHTNTTISKASKLLNFVKRNLSSCLKSTKESTYLSLVRPTLEYASSVWTLIKQFILPILKKSKEEQPVEYFMILADTAV